MVVQVAHAPVESGVQRPCLPDQEDIAVSQMLFAIDALSVRPGFYLQLLMSRGC